MRNNSEVFVNLSHEIQIQGLRTYLLTYGQYYVSLSLNDLCSLFELPEGGIIIIRLFKIFTINLFI
jgi:hypothetical protein